MSVKITKGSSTFEFNISLYLQNSLTAINLTQAIVKTDRIVKGILNLFSILIKLYGALE